MSVGHLVVSIKDKNMMSLDHIELVTDGRGTTLLMIYQMTGPGLVDGPALLMIYQMTGPGLMEVDIEGAIIMIAMVTTLMM